MGKKTTEKMRVFELAKELSMPAKQLIQKIRAFNIIVDGNFNVLTEEQIAFIKQKFSGKEDKTTFAPSDAAPERKRKIIRRAKAEEVAPDIEAEQPAEKKPRRIRKSKREEEAPPAEPVVEAEVPTPTSPPVEEKSAEAPVEEEMPSKEKPEEKPAPEPVLSEEPTPVEEPTPKSSELASPPERKLKKAAPAPAPTENKAPVSPKAKDKKEERPKARANKKMVVESDELGYKKGSRASKESRRDKKTMRFGEERHLDGRPKRQNKRVTLSRSEDGETETWQRPKRKRDRRKAKVKPVQEQKHTFNPRKKSIKIGPTITVGELAGAIGIKVSEIIKKLMEAGTIATINQAISGENAALIAAEFNIDVELDTAQLEDVLEEVEQGELLPRASIVTIMGHVDHGKTSLLDKIRATHVTEGEAGGITQHIGAYHVQTDFGDITFLDTPGHEAFTAMRARGANITDIVVLVVAADDGVQPQTVEAIHHAQAAGVPIIVAINKIDRPEANPSRVQQELLEHELVAEELGGDTIFVKVSAKTGKGIDSILEMIQLQTEVLELKAPAEGRARGVIIESKISTSRGPVGTVLIQKGTLKVGDYYVVGETFGKVRALFNDRGQAIEAATPSLPAEVLGFNSVPDTGEHFIVLDDEKTARQIAATRVQKSKDAVAAQQQKLHLENLFSRISSEENVELNILIKADVQGSVEALQSSLSQIGNENVAVNFIHTAAGNITENDVMLASASDAIIIGFNTSLDAKAREANFREGVDLRLYSVIYDAIEDVKKALEGLLKPTLRDEIIGRCEVRQLFTASKSGQILGCYVTEGKLLREASVRVLRNEDVIHEGGLVSLKRFKDDVREVQNNYECGIVINTEEVQVGDIIEAYIQVEETTRL